MKIRYLQILFLSLIIHSGIAQSPNYKNYGVKDGLPSSEIFHVFQDSKGYIWFATNNGVSKFDGYKFKNYNLENGLTDLTVFEIFEDEKERLWFITFSASFSYFEKGKIHEYKYNDSIAVYSKYGKGPEKLGFYVDGNDNLYFCDANNGLITVDSLGNVSRTYLDIKDNRRFTSILIDSSKLLIPNRASSVPFDYWMMIEPVNLRLEINHDLFKRISNVRGIGIYENQKYFIGIKDVLYALDKNNKLTYNQIGNEIIWVYTDSYQNLWISTYKNGAYRFTKGNINSKPLNLFKDYTITSILEDREGSFWFSTIRDGVFYLPNINIKTTNKKDGLLSNHIKSIEYENDTMWIGYFNSGCSMLSQNKIDHYPIKSKPSEVLSFVRKFNDKVIIGTTSHLYELKNGKVNEIFNNPCNERNRISDNLSLFASNKNYYTGHGTGYKIHTYDSIIYSSIDIEPVFKKRILSIYKYRGNLLLLGCIDGLWTYNQKEYNYLGNENELFKTRINIIKYWEERDLFLLGTKGSGIYLTNLDSIFQLTTNEGLISNSITSISQDNNTLWISTYNGISKIEFDEYNLNNYRIHNISTIHGLSSNEINDLLTTDSIVYIATNEGLTQFMKNKIQINNKPPPIYISRIFILNKDTTLLNTYKLPYDHNFITINYVGLSFKNAGNHKYAYKLKGTEEKWNLTTNTQIQYPSLPHGNYTFMVKAQNEDGIWSTKPAKIIFEISPPFWKTWWFYLIISILGIAILYFIYLLRVREINKRHETKRLETIKINELKREMDQFRLLALSMQMNPHFIFNTLNSIQYFILENNKKASNKYLIKFSKLIRIALENSQSQYISIRNELESLNLFLELESLRFENKFEYVISCPDEVLEYKIPTLLLQPYVENSIWHGMLHKKEGKGSITITIKPQDEALLCIIADNGIGRKEAEKIKQKTRRNHRSLGTNITEKRLSTIDSLYGKKIHVKFIDLKDIRGNANGTKVEILIPSMD